MWRTPRWICNNHRRRWDVSMTLHPIRSGTTLFAMMVCRGCRPFANDLTTVSIIRPAYSQHPVRRLILAHAPQALSSYSCRNGRIHFSLIRRRRPSSCMHSQMHSVFRDHEILVSEGTILQELPFLAEVELQPWLGKRRRSRAKSSIGCQASWS